jgi:hypothetical protein
LRKELYWAKVAGVNWHDRRVSYEFLRKATAGSYEFCVGPEAIRSSREALSANRIRVNRRFTAVERFGQGNLLFR